MRARVSLGRSNIPRGNVVAAAAVVVRSFLRRRIGGGAGERTGARRMDGRDLRPSCEDTEPPELGAGETITVSPPPLPRPDNRREVLHKDLWILDARSDLL